MPTFRNIVADPISHILNNYAESYNLICEGKQGIGKSGSMISLCLAVDPDFSASRIVFTTKQYIEMLKNEKLKVGSAYIFDECGDEIGSRSAMTGQQRRLMAVKQADRVLGLLGCFTLPRGTMIDKQLRQMAHATMEGKKKDRGTSQAGFKYMINTFNFDFKTGNPIYEFPTLILPNGLTQRVATVWIDRPPQIIWNQYVKLKMENLNRLYDGVLSHKDIQKQGEKEDYKAKLMSHVNLILEKPDEYLSNSGKNFSKELIRVNLNIPYSDAQTVAMLANQEAKKKGILTHTYNNI